MTSIATALSSFADKYGIALTNEAQAALPPELRALHRTILSAFVDTGTAPTTTWMSERADALGLNPGQALARLAEADLVHTAGGAVTVAYPFSGTPTPHRVQLDDGPAVWAMCGADALGIPLMIHRSATISSTDPHTGEAIRIRWHGGAWTWEPTGTVMLIAATTGCTTAAEATCRHIHFFTSRGHAEAHLQANPALAGEIYEGPDAIEVGGIIFGSLLGR